MAAVIILTFNINGETCAFNWIMHQGNRIGKVDNYDLHLLFQNSQNEMAHKFGALWTQVLLALQKMNT